MLGERIRNIRNKIGSNISPSLLAQNLSIYIYIAKTNKTLYRYIFTISWRE